MLVVQTVSQCLLNFFVFWRDLFFFLLCHVVCSCFCLTFAFQNIVLVSVFCQRVFLRSGLFVCEKKISKKMVDYHGQKKVEFLYRYGEKQQKETSHGSSSSNAFEKKEQSCGRLLLLDSLWAILLLRTFT